MGVTLIHKDTLIIETQNGKHDKFAWRRYAEDCEDSHQRRHQRNDQGIDESGEYIMSRNNSKRRVARLIIFAVLSILLIMQISTNSLMKRIRDAFLSTDYYIHEFWYNRDPQNYAHPDVNYVIYGDDMLYNIERYFNKGRGNHRDDLSYVNITVKLHRVFAIHNFRSGYLWLTYDARRYDREGKLIYGAISPLTQPVKMKIQKVDGEWQAMRIWDGP